MKKYILFSFGLLSVFYSLSQQTTGTITPALAADTVEKKRFDPERAEIGAGFSLDITQSGINLGLLPVGTYNIYKFIHLGVSPNVTYYQDFVTSLTDIRFGGSVFGRAFIGEMFYGQLELDMINYRTTFDPGISRPRRWVASAMLGLGYRREISIGHTFLTASYIVNYRQLKTPYSSPIVVRGGITIPLTTLFK